MSAGIGKRWLPLSEGKTNLYLERALMTGIIGVRKASYEASESIFSDLNNLEAVTTTSDKYEECFDQQTVA